MLILIKYWKPLAAMLLFILWTVLVHNDGAARDDAKWSARWHQHVAEDSQQVAANEAAARVHEQETLAAWSAAADIQQEELNHVRQNRDRLLADLRAGRLLWPGKCPAVLPQAPADTGEPEAGAEGRQPGLAGEEIIARLAVCDEVVSERNQAVRLLESWQR